MGEGVDSEKGAAVELGKPVYEVGEAQVMEQTSETSTHVKCLRGGGRKQISSPSQPPGGRKETELDNRFTEPGEIIGELSFRKLTTVSKTENPLGKATEGTAKVAIRGKIWS